MLIDTDGLLKMVPVGMAQKVIAGVKEKLRERQMRQLQASQAIADNNQATHGQRRFLESGEVKMMIPGPAFHYWGQREGYQCWEDDQFCRQFLRDNPACRVKSRSAKIQTGFGMKAEAGLSAAYMPRSDRFHKAYA